MKIGLSGFTQSGKSTLFEAITGLSVDKTKSSTTKSTEAIVSVEDQRLNFLSSIYLPQKHTPATLEIIDYDGLIPKENKINSFILSNLRNVDLLAIVLDGFSNENLNLVQTLQNFWEELIFADMLILNNRIEKLNLNLKKGKNLEQRKKDEQELEILNLILPKLEQNKKLNASEFSKEQLKILKCFQLFTLKPYVVIVNVKEENLKTDQDIKQLLQIEKDVIKVCATLEKEFIKLDKNSQQEFIKEWGMNSIVKDNIIKLAYNKAGLISFFTVGKDECKAWTIPQGSTALEASGKIHSDIQRGFIRAEVVSFDNFYKYKSMKEIKALGLHKIEGKDYIVQDGDIILFRFNV